MKKMFILLLFVLIPIVSSSPIQILQGQHFIGTSFQTGIAEFNFTVYDSFSGGNVCYSVSKSLTRGVFGQWYSEEEISPNCTNSSIDYFIETRINGVLQDINPQGDTRKRLTMYDYLRKGIDDSIKIESLIVSKILTYSPLKFIDSNTNETIFIINDDLFGGRFTFENKEIMVNDNRNGSSRFTVKNKNLDTNAKAFITADNGFLVNGISNKITFGITGENARINPIDEGSTPFLVPVTPHDMLFAHSYFNGFRWYNNLQNDANVINITNILLELDRYGNLNVSNNITAINARFDNLEVEGVISGTLSLGSSFVNISNGQINYSAFYMSVLGEYGNNDDLDTINGGNDGDVLNIFPTNSNSDIKLRHGVGNLNLGGVDCNLKSIGTKAELRKSDSEWKLIICLN